MHDRFIKPATIKNFFKYLMLMLLILTVPESGILSTPISLFCMGIVSYYISSLFGYLMTFTYFLLVVHPTLKKERKANETDPT